MLGLIRYQNSAMRPILAAIAIFAVGFLVMATLWWTGSWDANLSGFGNYRSATFGDAILLPFLAAVLLAAGDRLPHAQREAAVVAIASLAGGLLGSCVVGGWLWDSTPQLN